MIELGKMQKLKIVRDTSVGVYLIADDENEDILLPKKQVPSGADIGDEVEVFVYRDSEDRMIATTKTPKLIIGEIGYLEAVQITKIGAFLDWGLDKDVLLPFKEQLVKIKKGGEYLVGLYIDKSDRLCASMKVYSLLSSESPYKENDRVKGMIYTIKTGLGALVAVDNKYHGLIPERELYGEYSKGDEVDVRVSRVREDGKLELSVRKKAYKQIDNDSRIVLNVLSAKGGFISLNDKSSPDRIKEEMNMSKSSFKKAVGKLLKEREIKFVNDGIQIQRK